MMLFALVDALKIVLLVTLSMLIFGCAGKIHFHEQRVLPYRFELERLKHKEQPYFAIYTRENKTLIYLASKHLSSKEYPNLLEHPTIKTIDSIFNDYKPQAVIVEGVVGDLTSDSIRRRADECKAMNYRGCGESFFAINRARQEGIMYVSGEPSDRTILGDIKKEGYTANDLLGFYVVRQIPQLKRHDNIDKLLFKKQIELWLTIFKRDMDIESSFDYDRFMKWYSDHMDIPQDVLDIKGNDAAPHGGEDSTYVQRISHAVSHMRNREVVKTIERMLNQFDCVLVVYGGSHLITQGPALDDAMGTPRYLKLH